MSIYHLNMVMFSIYPLQYLRKYKEKFEDCNDLYGMNQASRDGLQSDS